MQDARDIRADQCAVVVRRKRGPKGPASSGGSPAGMGQRVPSRKGVSRPRPTQQSDRASIARNVAITQRYARAARPDAVAYYSDHNEARQTFTLGTSSFGLGDKQRRVRSENWVEFKADCLAVWNGTMTDDEFNARSAVRKARREAVDMETLA